MSTVACIFGTRPEAIKLAPLVLELRDRPGFDVVTVSTGQHREMVRQVTDWFKIDLDHDLGVMTPRQSLPEIISRVSGRLPSVLQQIKPDLVVVQGDTSTAFVGALMAFYEAIPVAHVEAGLRTGTIRNPFPEELNRVLISKVADLHFAPSELARRNLLDEGVDEASIAVTGNTGVDAFRLTARTTPLEREPSRRQHLLVTLHRRENWGRPLEEACRGLRMLLAELPNLEIVFPMHANPRVRETVVASLGDLDRVTLTEHMSYPDFCTEIARSTLVLTDSGGIQEEAPALGVPVIVYRHGTERREAVDAGTARLVPLDGDSVRSVISELLTDPSKHRAMAEAVNPYGDGFAARRIVDHLERWLPKSGASFLRSRSSPDG